MIVAFAVLLVPISAAAVTIQDIIGLSEAGVPDAVLVALIDADRSIFTLDAGQILELRDAGVTDQVVTKMLRSRAEFEIASDVSPSVPPPTFVVVGADAPSEPSPALVTVVVPLYLPVPVQAPAPRQGADSGHRHPQRDASLDIAPSGLPPIALPIRNGEFVTRH
jgi:hypothetical protein